MFLFFSLVEIVLVVMVRCQRTLCFFEGLAITPPLLGTMGTGNYNKGHIVRARARTFVYISWSRIVPISFKSSVLGPARTLTVVDFGVRWWVLRDVVAFGNAGKILIGSAQHVCPCSARLCVTVVRFCVSVHSVIAVWLGCRVGATLNNTVHIVRTGICTVMFNITML